MSGPVLVVSDLDRTLIYSTSALSLPMDDAQAPTLVCVEVIDGRPHSFMTMRALRTLQHLDSVAVFVPVTTRTVEQYRRVRFTGVTPAFAITSNGGTIIAGGEVDEEWSRLVRDRIAAGGADLSTVQAELRRRTDPGWALKRRTGDAMFCYLVVDPLIMPGEFLDQWRQWCADRGWRVSMQGRKIYAVPESLSKEAAMREVAARVGAGRTLAAGDGALDAGLLTAADRAIRPPHGELDTLGWRHPTVQVSERPGVLAADDITAWFVQQLV